MLQKSITEGDRGISLGHPCAQVSRQKHEHSPLIPCYCSGESLHPSRQGLPEIISRNSEVMDRAERKTTNIKITIFPFHSLTCEDFFEYAISNIYRQLKIKWICQIYHVQKNIHWSMLHAKSKHHPESYLHDYMYKH